MARPRAAFLTNWQSSTGLHVRCGQVVGGQAWHMIFLFFFYQ
jgi:hypothetical protein